MENRNGFDVDDEQENGRDSEYGTVPSMESPHTRIDTTEIKPTGTGCRTCIVFLLIVGAVLGFVYFYYQNQEKNQPAPANTPPGQTQR